MKKRMMCLLLTLALLAGLTAAPAEQSKPTEAPAVFWLQEERARLSVGNPTPLQGRFFTSFWGGATSDLDVQDLLHGYSPVLWDENLDRFRFDHSVIQDGLILDDEEGNRRYILVFYTDLKYSDGTPITAKDYAFSFLFQLDRVIAETGGKAPDCSWLAGAEAYQTGDAGFVSGLRVISDQILQITVRAEALPYFYELDRLRIHPWPVHVIAPGVEVLDDGEGAYLSRPLTAEGIRATVLDEETGYLSHPPVVSGPYCLTFFDGITAKLEINPYYKGDEEGRLPRIGELEYTVADNSTMVDRLKDGAFGLLNKVTEAEAIRQGIQSLSSGSEAYAMTNYARSGLTLVWFVEQSRFIQEQAVRKAIACCFDREGFTQDYTGPFGLPAEGFFGIGQWMYRVSAGLQEPPVAENETEENVARWETLSLDGLTRYPVSVEEAVRLLEQAGWTLNSEGKTFVPAQDEVRCKKVNGSLIALDLTLAIPDSEDTEEALQDRWIQNLNRAGIRMTVQRRNMPELQKIYTGEASDGVDLVYLGDNFSLIFDPGILKPQTDLEGELSATKADLYDDALEMIRTEPTDVFSFLQKWIALQERIMDTLPLIPVYTNVYFDFYTRQLHDYRITESITWGEAIRTAFMSDSEELEKDEKEAMKIELQNWMEQLEQPE